jgi:diguanylate cyclase
LRDGDLVARYGGEEFCIILPNTDLKGAFTLINSLRRRVYLVQSNGPISVSAGVATWDREEDFASLVARADRALYRAKSIGRNRVVRDYPDS